MLRFISKHKGGAVMAAVVLLTLIMAVSSFFTKGRVSPLANVINTAFQPLHSLIGSVGDYFAERSEAVKRYDELRAEYDRLRVHFANMEQERRLVEDVMRENERLREMLALQPRERGFELDIAAVVARDTSAWERTLTLSKGSESGIEVGMCVVSPEMYLVGIVTRAGPGWATVHTVTDTITAAGARVDRTGQTAVAEGEWASMLEGRLRLNYLPLGSDILHGDLILTSGLGGVYPPGLPIGTVAGVHVGASGQSEYAELVPSAQIDTLTQVFVILEYISKE